MILICYIFSTNKVLEIRLVVLIPLTTTAKFNWQLCLKLTDPNFAWFNSQSTKKVPTLGLAFSYLRTPVLSVFYAGAKPQQNFENYVWEFWANWSTFFSDVWLLMLSKSNIWGYLSNICISEGEGTWVKVPCDWGMQYLGWGLGRSPSEMLNTY